MGTLTPTEIMGLYVTFSVQFLPIAVIALMAIVRYAHYLDAKRVEARVRHSSLQVRDLSIFDFVAFNQTQYEAHRRTVPVIFPFHLYLLWMFCNAGIEAASMFLVWFDPGSYHNWVYQTSMGFEFVIILCKVYWLIAFFAVTHYKSAAIATGLLLVFTLTNAIIIAINNPHIVYNWVLDWLAVVFYVYSFLLMVHFYNVSERSRYWRGTTSLAQIDVIGMLFPHTLDPAVPRGTGVQVDRANRTTERHATGNAK